MDGLGAAGEFVTDEILVDAIKLLHDIGAFELVGVEMEGALFVGEEISALAEDAFVGEDFVDVGLIDDELGGVRHECKLYQIIKIICSINYTICIISMLIIKLIVE